MLSSKHKKEIPDSESEEKKNRISDTKNKKEKFLGKKRKERKYKSISDKRKKRKKLEGKNKLKSVSISTRKSDKKNICESEDEEISDIEEKNEEKDINEKDENEEEEIDENVDNDEEKNESEEEEKNESEEEEKNENKDGEEKTENEDVENENENEEEISENIDEGKKNEKEDEEEDIMNGEEKKGEMIDKKSFIKKKLINKAEFRNSKDYKIFVGNISYKCKNNDLKTFFLNCGKIKEVNIEKNFNGKSRGQGYVIFKTLKAMNKALQKDGKIFKGRQIIIKKFIENNKNSIIILQNKVNNLENWQQLSQKKMKKYKKELKENEKKMEKYEEDLKGAKKELKETNKELKETKKELKETKKELKGTKKELNTKIGLLIEINAQTEHNNNRNFNALNDKINKVINSYKILYIRKFANFILDGLIKRYPKYLAKTVQKFSNDDDKYSFSLIVAQKDIKGIDKYKINLMVDYLMETKQNTSKVIHIGNEEAIIQKEIFDELVKNQNISANKKSKVLVNTDDMISVIFGSKDIHTKKNKTNFAEIDNKINKFINEYIEEEEKEDIGGKEKQERKKISKEENFIDLTSYLESSKKQEKYIDVSLEDSKDTIDDDIKRIENIMSGENNQETLKINSLLKILFNKIKVNYINDNSDETKHKHEEIDSNFFYSLWKESFEKQKYKKGKDYKRFIKKDKIESIEKMGKTIKYLLPDLKYELFGEDPRRFENRISTSISQYN